MHFFDQDAMRLDAKQIHYRGGIILNQFDAIIRESDQHHLLRLCTIRQFEALKVYCLNSAAITQSRINYIHHNYFYIAESDSYNWICKFTFGHNDLIKMVGGPPLIVKLLEREHKVKELVLAREQKKLQKVLLMLSKFKRKHISTNSLKQTVKIYACLLSMEK
jgi:ribosomal protein S6--L-glutamate ligase